VHSKVDHHWFSEEMLRILGKTTENRRFRHIARELHDYPLFYLDILVSNEKSHRVLPFFLDLKVDANWFSGEMLKISNKITEYPRFRPVYRGNDMVTHFVTLTFSYQMKDRIDFYHSIYI
jgi:hypothetical protein